MSSEFETVDNLCDTLDDLINDELSKINLDPVTTKHTVKDSVFQTLFSDKENVLKLYRGLHPEDISVTVKDIHIGTLKSTFINELFNDLGFVVGEGKDAKFMILVEAQSKWNPNMTLRILIYLAISIRNYLVDTKQNMHDDVRVKLPMPELYVIYTGGGEAPMELSFNKDYFDGLAPVDIKVKVRQQAGQTMDGQYIGFCQVYNEQRKLYGKSKQCMEETIRLCIEKDYLTDFLITHREEVTTMMDELFDAEYQMKSYRESRDARIRAEGEAVGEAKGREEGLLEGFFNAIASMVKDGIITLTEGANRVNMSEDDFKLKAGLA